MTEPQFRRLKEAGVSRVHNNLETSEKHFPNICTTHTFADKVSAIQAAQRAELTVCSGGIMGMGETMADRIDMALSLRDLGITSVPVNVLNPIPGTPFGEYPTLSEAEVLRILALYRFLCLPLPSVWLEDVVFYRTAEKAVSSPAPTLPLPGTCSPPQALRYRKIYKCSQNLDTR